MSKISRFMTLAIVLLCFAFPAVAAADPITHSIRHEYRTGPLDSDESARLIAMEQARRILLNEAAGKLADYADIRILQLDRRDLSILIAPLAQVKLGGEERKEGAIRIQASVRVEPLDAVRFLNAIVASSGKAQELRDIRKRTDFALAEIDRIGGSKRADRKNPQPEETYRRAVEELVLSGYLLRGWGHLWSCRYREAVEEFSQALSRRPDQAEIYRQRGVAWLKLKDPGRALADFNRALELNPRYAHAYANRGYFYMEAGDPEKAVLDFNRALELKRPNEDPDPAEDISLPPPEVKQDTSAKPAQPGALKEGPAKILNIERYRRLALQKMGAPKPDAAYFTAVLERNPGYAPAFYGRALAHQAAGHHQAALDDFNQAIRLMPENPLYYHARAGCYGAMKRSQEAIADYSRAIELNARLPQSHFERGLLSFQSGDYRSAAADFARTTELEPGNANAARMRDTALGKLGRKPDVSYLDTVIAENPRRPYAYTQRAIAYWMEGRIAGAIEDCTTVIRLKPDEARAHLIRGILYGGAADYRKALDDHERALAMVPGDLLVFGSRVKAFGGDSVLYDKALSDYKKILQLNAQKAAPALYRGVANFFLGNYEDALIDCRKAIEIDPLFGPAYRWHGIIHYVLGSYELAGRYFDQAVRHAPKDPLSYYLRGIALSGLGKKAEAVASLKEGERLGMTAARDELIRLKYYKDDPVKQPPAGPPKKK